MLLDGRADGEVLLVGAGSGGSVSVGQVRARSQVLRQAVGAPGLAFLLCGNTLGCVTDFLALVEAGVPVALVDAGLDADLLAGLVDRYRPDVLLGEGYSPPAGYAEALPGVWAGPAGPVSHPELCVLLTTSGSTGSPKLVRLSAANIEANARQIVDSLGLRPTDRGVTALPLFYSFGMSVVTSHAVAGSSVLVTDRGVLDPVFWEDLDSFGVSFLPGVPPTFAMLKRLRFEDRDLPGLRALIQAGGRLAPELVEHFAGVMRARGGQFFVMYGQTEAGPRIACLPPDRLPEKLGSAGVALAGGRLVAVDGDRELPAGGVGEIVYCGPNVMMGYAQSREDLALGDVQGDVLRTGDLGFVDGEGFLFLTGRSKRIAKVAGSRVSLDEVEAWVGHLAPVAAVDAGDSGLAVFTTVQDPDVLSRSRRDLARRLHVPASGVSVRPVPALPLLGSGKVDYRTLTSWAQEGR